MRSDKMDKAKKVLIILLIGGVVGFLILVITLIGIMSTPPNTIKVYYYDFSSGQEKEVNLKKIDSGIGTDDSIGDINLPTNFFDVVRYATYEDFSFPQQTFKDWKFLGYSYKGDLYGYKRKKNFASSNRYHHYSAILEKVVSTVKIKEGRTEHIIEYTERIVVGSNGEVTSAKLQETETFKNQVKGMFENNIDFGGVYDEPEGGICIINEKFEVLADSSSILDRTLYVHKKQFQLNITDAHGKVITTEKLAIGENMPQLTMEVPDGYILTGWKIAGTDRLITNGNEYLTGYGVLSSDLYQNFINDNTITICPVIQHIKVELSIDDSIIKCKYGEYLAYVPSTDNEHSVFCGWKYANGQMFDGFVTKNIELIPIWNSKNYKFDFVLNGGESKSDLSEIYYSYGTQLVSLPNAVTKEGYEFIGWFSSPDEDAIQYSNAVGVLMGDYSNFTESNYTINNNTVTLYAHYRQVIIWQN